MAWELPSGWPTSADKRFHRRPGVWSNSEHRSLPPHRTPNRWQNILAPPVIRPMLDPRRG
jgi:hypothetical protein